MNVTWKTKVFMIIEILLGLLTIIKHKVISGAWWKQKLGVGQSTGLVKITDSLTQLLNYGQYSTFK